MSVMYDQRYEENLKRRYLRFSRFILLLAICCSLWITILLLGTYYWGYGNKWAFLSLNEWIYSIIGVIVLFILLEFFFIFHHFKVRRYLMGYHLKPRYFQGKRLYHYTIPKDAKGGIFSKTFVAVDEQTIITFRYQMIPSQDLWGSKKL